MESMVFLPKRLEKNKSLSLFKIPKSEFSYKRPNNLTKHTTCESPKSDESLKSDKLTNESLKKYKSLKNYEKVPDTITDKRKIIKYFDNLFKFLNKYCFIKGAFVIADDNEQLFELLKYVDYINLTNHNLETHIKYKDKTEDLKEIDLTPEYITSNCKAEENCKRVRQFHSFKWYRFNNNKGDKFIFVKPEREPTFSKEHVANAVNRYLLSTGKETDCVYHRREDCDIDKNCDHEGKPLPYRNFTKVIINGSSYDVEETYDRKGDEAFIIEPVSKFIIDLINNNKINDIRFIYDYENNNMIITSNSDLIGGKYKKYSKAT